MTSKFKTASVFPRKRSCPLILTRRESTGFFVGETGMKLTSEIVQELLDYDPEMGIFTWRERGWEWFKTERGWKAWNARYAGAPAGYIHKGATGYPRVRIKLLGTKYAASRLAFLAMGEPLPDQVDHLNRDSLDDRWSNLAASNSAENHKNLSMSRTNTSGVCGVGRHKATGRWLARVQLGGESHHLGLFDDINEAAAVVAEFRAANGFTDGHGQTVAGYASC